MSNPIIPKTNSSAGPGAPESLYLGELASNRSTGKLYLGCDTGVVEVGGSGGISGTVPIASGGTGQTSRQPALNALAGAVTANNVLRANGTNIVLAKVQANSDIDGILPVANGGTGQSNTPTNGQLLIGNSSTGGYSKTTLQAGNNVTITNGPGQITISATGGGGGGGTTDLATGVTGVLGLTNGGTGQATRQGAINALAGAVTANRVLKGDGANIALGQVALATDVSGTLPVTSGGTGQTAFTDGQLLIGNTATGGLSKAALTAGDNITITNSNGGITINSTAASGNVGSTLSTFTGDGTSIAFFPILGFTDTQAGSYIVSVGGIDQLGYSITSANQGTLVFTSAPASGVPISVRAFTGGASSGAGSGNAVTLQSRTVAATAPTGGQVLGWNAMLQRWEPMSVQSAPTGGTITFNTAGVHVFSVPANVRWARVQATSGAGTAGTDGTDGEDGQLGPKINPETGEPYVDPGTNAPIAHYGEDGVDGVDGVDGKSVKIALSTIVAGGKKGTRGYGGGGGGGVYPSGPVASGRDGRGDSYGRGGEGGVNGEGGYSPNYASRGGDGYERGGDGHGGQATGYSGSGGGTVYQNGVYFAGGGGAGWDRNDAFPNSGSGGGGGGGSWVAGSGSAYFYSLGGGGKGGKGSPGGASQSIDVPYDFSSYAGTDIDVEITSGNGTASITITW